MELWEAKFSHPWVSANTREAKKYLFAKGHALMPFPLSP